MFLIRCSNEGSSFFSAGSEVCISAKLRFRGMVGRGQPRARFTRLEPNKVEWSETVASNKG